MNLGWYLRRLQRMEPAELAGRASDLCRRILWQYSPPDIARDAQRQLVSRPAIARLQSLPAPAEAPASAMERLIACADEILDGRWQVFAQQHPDFGRDPCWFVDAKSGKHMPASDYSFSIRYRDEARVGNIKYVWEPSRHHHLTVLAAAYYLTREDRYAERAAAHLQSWWSKNPFMRGPHWLSGIELGLRLIAWCWTRQLLAPWQNASGLFEENDEFIAQLYAHQIWLASFPSRGSSANNHIIAEAAGQLMAATVFPLFRQSERWRRDAMVTLEQEAVAQTFSCGANRELATDYQGFVLELLLAASLQAASLGDHVPEGLWTVIRRMSDATAAMLDDRGLPPRQGDGDDGIGLMLDADGGNRWTSLLHTGKKLFGARSWWPASASSEGDVRTFLWASSQQLPELSQPAQRPNLLEEAGLIIRRSASPAGPVWCRCDIGPHGFGRIAAHAHADALSLELRIGGIEVFADPGTYCYHGDPRWRDYFRSTFAHNTLCLGDKNQSQSGGPFLWTRHAETHLLSARGLETMDEEASWLAEHTGYLPEMGLKHRRFVSLSHDTGNLVVRDAVTGKNSEPVNASLSWHLGPLVKCVLRETVADLSWPGGEAALMLPPEMIWTCSSGDDQVPAGWYSPAFDQKIPASTLVGRCVIDPAMTLTTSLLVRPPRNKP